MSKRDTTASKGKTKGVRFFLIVLAGTVFAVIFHQLHHDPLMTLATKERSIIITSGYFPPAAFASLAVAYLVIALTFLAIQRTLHGSKRVKGVLFGVALGGMYLVGMIEAYVVYPVPLLGEIYTGMVDGLGILLMSLLLGRYVADDAPGGGRPVIFAFPAVLIIPMIYVLMRYFSYAVLHIDSAYSTAPLATFIWTAGMGLWIGIMYMLVGGKVRPGSPFKHALVFGGLVFGINWIIFNLFVLLFIKVSVLDLLYRSIFDALAVIIGVYISALLLKKRAIA